MPTLHRLNGAAAPHFVDAMQAAATPLAVPRQLLQLMASVGITSPGDVDRLSESQLAKLCENRTPGQRIEIKGQVMAAGIYPRTLPTFSRIAQ